MVSLLVTKALNKQKHRTTERTLLYLEKICIKKCVLSGKSIAAGFRFIQRNRNSSSYFIEKLLFLGETPIYQEEVLQQAILYIYKKSIATGAPMILSSASNASGIPLSSEESTRISVESITTENTLYFRESLTTGTPLYPEKVLQQELRYMI
jgi:hypothetical protein